LLASILLFAFFFSHFQIKRRWIWLINIKCRMKIEITKKFNPN
jgi:hypothetical protein